MNFTPKQLHLLLTALKEYANYDLDFDDYEKSKEDLLVKIKCMILQEEENKSWTQIDF